MRISRIEDSSRLYADEALLKLISLSIYNPTFGKVKSAAESLYSKEQGKFFTAEDESGRIVGILGAKRIDNDRLELKHLAVDEAMRGQGIARQLIVGALRAEGVPTMTAEVDHNLAAFFRKCGFTTWIKRDDAMGDEFYLCTLTLEL